MNFAKFLFIPIAACALLAGCESGSPWSPGQAVAFSVAYDDTLAPDEVFDEAKDSVVATVSVDGKEVGQTPCEAKVDGSKDHEVVFSLEGYDDYKKPLLASELQEYKNVGVKATCYVPFGEFTKKGCKCTENCACTEESDDCGCPENCDKCKCGKAPEPEPEPVVVVAVEEPAPEPAPEPEPVAEPEPEPVVVVAVEEEPAPAPEPETRTLKEIRGDINALTKDYQLGKISKNEFDSKLGQLNEEIEQVYGK